MDECMQVPSSLLYLKNGMIIKGIGGYLSPPVISDKVIMLDIKYFL